MALTDDILASLANADNAATAVISALATARAAGGGGGGGGGGVPGPDWISPEVGASLKQGIDNISARLTEAANNVPPPPPVV